MRKIDQELFNAVIINDLVAVRKAFEKGAELNNFDIGLLRYSPSIEIVKFLVHNGLDIYKFDKDSANCLYGLDSVEVARFLVNRGVVYNTLDKNNASPLHSAKNLEVVKYFIKLGLDPNAKDKNGMTPLFNAMNRRDNETVKYLTAYMEKNKLQSKL